MTDANACKKATLTPLEERLITLIDDHGPIRVGDYMADALGHPQHGYYMTEAAFGSEGDFTTAPEISQIFGELIGAWLVNAWEEIGAPSLFNLIELGPGRGTLMADILRTAKVRPKFLKAARVYMIETSGRQRYAQQRKLQDIGQPITWATELHDIPAAPTLFIANEFFDCLPIRQFIKTTQENEPSWRENLVSYTQTREGKRLCFVLSEALHNTPTGAPAGAKPEDIFEFSADAQSLIRDIAVRLQAHKGRALIIDYGHGRSGFGSTVQAVKNHQYWHPLEAPGMADVTAHVDFATLARTGREKKLLVHGPERQGRFLSRLGFDARKKAILKTAEKEAHALVLSGADRLVNADEMGTLFKALCLSSPSLKTPAGFEG